MSNTKSGKKSPAKGNRTNKTKIAATSPSNRKSKENSPSKPVYKKWWFWVIVVLVLIGLAGGSSSNKESSQSNDDTGSPQTTQVSSSTNVAKEYHVGDDVPAGKSTIKVLNVEYGFTSGSEYWGPDEGTEWVKVTIQQSNTSSDKISFNALYWAVRDGNGVEENYLHTGIGSSTDDFFGSGDLAPGGTKTGSIVFQIPAGDRNLTLVYKNTFERAGKAEIKL